MNTVIMIFKTNNQDKGVGSKMAVMIDEPIECQEYERGHCEGPGEWDIFPYDNHCGPNGNQYSCMKHRILERLREERLLKDQAESVIHVLCPQEYLIENGVTE